MLRYFSPSNRKVATDLQNAILSIMAQRISAGLFLYEKHGGELRVLLMHPGGPYFRKKDAGYWSVPKGEIDPGEDFLITARREFEEETGHVAPADALYIPLGSIVQKGGKIVHAWAFEGKWDPGSFRSNLFPMEWPPGSGKTTHFPEADRAEMLSVKKAIKKIKPTQIPLIERLVEALKP